MIPKLRLGGSLVKGSLSVATPFELLDMPAIALLKSPGDTLPGGPCGPASPASPCAPGAPVGTASIRSLIAWNCARIGADSSGA
jgi:hypothetical protein